MHRTTARALLVLVWLHAGHWVRDSIITLSSLADDGYRCKWGAFDQPSLVELCLNTLSQARRTKRDHGTSDPMGSHRDNCADCCVHHLCAAYSPQGLRSLCHLALCAGVVSDRGIVVGT